MNTRNIKKGFTLTELIIVIVIIGILAGVLIPTFINVVNKANKAADLSLIRNLNEALTLDRYDRGEHKHMNSALDAVEEYGFGVAKIDAKVSKNKILWDSKNDVFCYLDNGILEYYPKSVDSGEEVDPDGPLAYKLWIIDNKVNSKFSTYLYGYSGTTSQSSPLIASGVGIDTGDCEVAFVKYENTNTSDTKKVVIRTNSPSTTLIIDDESKGSIEHYDSVGALNIIKCYTGSYHENGQVAFAEIKTGRIVLENEAEIRHIHLTATGEGSEAYFDNITVAKAENVEMPDFSRDPVEIPDEGIVVVALQDGTDVDDNKDYVWLTAVGIYEQVTVSDSITDAGNNYAVDSDDQEKKEAAQQIANSITFKDGGVDYKVKATPVVGENDEVTGWTYDVVKSNGIPVNENPYTASESGNVISVEKTGSAEPIVPAVENGSDESEKNKIKTTEIADLVDEELAETVVRAVTSETTEYYSFKQFADKVNSGDFDDEENITFTLMANVNLKNVEWTPIGTEEHPFKWVFDGNGYFVKNFKILTNCKNHGLFGYVNGVNSVLGTGQGSLDSYWSDDSKTFDYSSFENIGQYKTVIKNLTVENAEIAETEYKAAAAVVGTAEHAYLQNINVKTSTINGFKGAGGIAGSIGDCVINNCNVDDETSIYASEYHGAGIAALNNNTSIHGTVDLANIILHCSNNAVVSSLKGNVGGIIGSAQNGSLAVIDCTNNGNISITGSGSQHIAGLVGGGNLGSYHQFLINSTNNGNVLGNTSQSMSGAITYCAVKAVNVTNNGDVIGTPGTSMAGIGAGSVANWSEYIGCVNNGTLTNNKPNGATYEINDDASVDVVVGTFADIAGLNAYLAEVTKKIVKLQCTVTDNSGTLIIPNNITSISSAVKVCSSIQFNQDRELNISVNLPEISYEYEKSLTIWFNCPNSQIIVPENITVPLLSIYGGNTEVTIRGNVAGPVTVYGPSTINNYGSITYISLRGANDAILTFNNYGEVGVNNSPVTQSVSTTGKINLTVNNHGLIKAADDNYALLFYGNSTVIFNAYANSTITKAEKVGMLAINNGPGAHAKLVTINIEEGAAGVNGNAYYGERASSSATYDCTLIINFNVVLPE